MQIDVDLEAVARYVLMSGDIDYGKSLENIRNITVGTQSPNGTGIIQAERQEHYLPIKFSVRDAIFLWQ